MTNGKLRFQEMEVSGDAQRWRAFLAHSFAQPAGRATAYAPPAATRKEHDRIMNEWADAIPTDGVPTGAKPLTETGWPHNEKVQCAKRIMDAVDIYHARPDAMNRTALRAVILTEMEEYADGVDLPDGSKTE